MDQKENIQNEKVAGEAGGLAVKSPTGKTAVMSSRKRRIEEEPVVSVVKFRSEDNINLLRVARQWLRSDEAQIRLKGIMDGSIPSERHRLFFDKKQREGNGASSYSRLYRMANTSFLGDDNDLDRSVITKLQDIYNQYIGQSEQRLQRLNERSDLALDYASVVLFPETFIHWHMSQGKTRESAEAEFLQVVVSPEESWDLEEEVERRIQELEEEEAANAGRQTDSDEDFTDCTDTEED